jgi:hypothetical protein
MVQNWLPHNTNSAPIYYTCMYLFDISIDFMQAGADLSESLFCLLSYFLLCSFLTIIRQNSSRTPLMLNVVYLENSDRSEIVLNVTKKVDGIRREVYLSFKRKCKCPQKMWVTFLK